MRLTDISIRALKAPPKGQVTHADDTLPGFGIRVSQGGTKTFVVVHGPTRQRTTVGRFPVISVADARAEARRLLAEATLGKHRPKTVSFDRAKDEFLEHCQRKNRPRTHNDYTRLLKHFPFGSTRLGDITKADIKRKLAKMDKTPAEQFHALVVVKIFFRFAVRQDYLDHSPCEGLQPKEPLKSRDRAFSSDELKAVVKLALVEPFPWGPIMLLLILTGQRRGEVGQLRWEWIDREAKTITLPASATKNRREHTIPYGPMAEAVLVKLPRIDDSPYLFPASKLRRKGQPATVFGGWAKCKLDFDKKLEGVAAYRLHDLRRTVSTTMASLGVPQIVVEKLLNHVSGGTQSAIAQVYNRHNYIDEMRAAMTTYEAYLGSLLKK
jgi:integrase